MKGSAIYEFYSNIETKIVEWLWYPYIPYGKLTVLQGDPGEGKSTLMINIAATLSTGGKLPTGESVGAPQTVIYQCAEDSPSDTIKPRLLAAKADCSKIAFIHDGDSTLTLDDQRIEEAIVATKARLVVIDPIQAFIPQDADMLNATKMRGVLRRLSDIAERHACAIVLIGHMNKAGTGKNIYRGLGSIDIVAIARSVLMIARKTDEPHIRYLFPVKSSLAPEGEAVAFEIGGDAGFKWIGKCDFDKETIEDSISFAKSKKDLAKKYLEELLGDGDLPSKIILEKLSNLGIGERTVNKAKSEMDIRTYKRNNVWFWHLNSIIRQDAAECDYE